MRDLPPALVLLGLAVGAGCAPEDVPGAPPRSVVPACQRVDGGRCSVKLPPWKDGGVSRAVDGAIGGADAAAAPGCEGPFVSRLAALMDDWPKLTVGTESRSFSSFDRTGGNADGFTGKYSELYVNEAGEHVIADAVGPGVLDTLWFTGPDEGGAGLDLGEIRLYLDEESTPRIALPWQDLFRGDRAPFLSPLVADNAVSTGAFVSFVPIPFARRLVITTGERPGFYQAHYTTLPPDATVTSFDPCQDVEPARAEFQAVAQFSPRPDVSVEPLDVTKSGAGVLDTIQFTPDHAPSAAELEAARIRITWDDQSEPAVDVPLGSFFGTGLGPAEVRALPFSIGGGVYEARFRMPYFSGFHLTITGLSGVLALHTSALSTDPGDVGRFHAVHSEARPTVPGQDFEWLSLPSSGKLVGTVLTVEPATPTTKKWWEGDLRSYANGRRTPGLNGTGHEDDHLGGWSDTFLKRPFSLPMNGEPRTDILDTTGQVNANSTLYRFYPGIEFTSGVRHSTEHGSRNGVSASYSGVAFYYAAPQSRVMVESDVLVVADPVSRSAHGYAADGEAVPAALTSAFEGRDDNASVTATVLAHTGSATFTIAVTAGNSGCLLRRLYDQHDGRQDALVRVDGEAVGRWYVAEGNTTQRWAERDYFLPSRHTASKSAIRVEVEPAEGAPAWAVAEYRLLCVKPGL